MLAQARTPAAASRRMRLILALVCAIGLAGCGPRRAEVPAAEPAVAKQGPVASVPAGATLYAIDSDRSVVTLRVYRAGRLAMLGHNHVVTSANESGYVWTKGTPGASGFEVRLAVADLVVDDPAARAAAGEEFPGTLSDAAREGTRKNMLRAEVLDGEGYPQIVVRGDLLGGTSDRATVAADVTLKGHTKRFDVPLDIVRDAGSIVARGAFSILQSDFCITPFSVGGGAIQVADKVDVAFEIHASRR